MALILRVGIGATFVLAGATKFGVEADFAQIVARYQLLPPRAPYLVAAILPWLEVICGSCLCLNVLTRSAGAWLAVLSGLFAGATGSALVRGLDLSCGCFEPDPDGQKITALHVALNLALALACLKLSLGKSLPKSMQQQTEQAEPGDQGADETRDQ